jgi:type IV pilus assembly protein PilC
MSAMEQIRLELRRRFHRRIAMEPMSKFCGNMSRCLAVGMDVPRSLRVSSETFPHRQLKIIADGASARVKENLPLSEALEPWRTWFPAFVLPLIQCGEQSGRLAETFEYLENHCRLLIGPVKTVRDTWLVPLCILIFGTAANTAFYWMLSTWGQAYGYLLGSLKYYGYTATVVFAAVYFPPARKFADRLLISLPLVGPAIRELAMNRFFHALNMLYSTGGRRVENMIRLAATSADNAAMEHDFLRAADAIERHATLAEAFDAVPGLPLEYRSLIFAGETAGKLSAAFDKICSNSAEAINARLPAFQAVFFRVVISAVLLSIAMTVKSLVH